METVATIGGQHDECRSLPVAAGHDFGAVGLTVSKWRGRSAMVSLLAIDGGQPTGGSSTRSTLALR
jgi:hypothetical protein